MRRIWTMLSVVAVANLLGLLGFVAWLVASDRLGVDRLREIRAMLSETRAAQAAREEAEEAAMDSAADEGDDRGVALSSADLVSLRLEGIEVDRERRERLSAEAEALRSALANQERILREQREAFERERRAFEDERARVKATDGDAQFRKAVKVLDGMRPQDAAEIIRAILGGGGDPLVPGDDAGDAGGGDARGAQEPREVGMDRAVSFVNAMQERTRLKLMTELAKDEPALAADLLERLRTRGVPADEDAPDP